jgi:hypothetical protein
MMGGSCDEAITTEPGASGAGEVALSLMVRFLIPELITIESTWHSTTIFKILKRQLEDLTFPSGHRFSQTRDAEKLG